MKSRKKKLLHVGTFFIILTIALIGTAFLWTTRHDLVRSAERAALPEAAEYNPSNVAPTTTTKPQPVATKAATKPVATVANLPTEANLAVPFVMQAPNANWAAPYKEFCEEASVLMAISYLKKETIPNAAVADQKLLAIKAFEDKRFGYYEDTNAQETATIINEFYKYPKTKLIKDPTVADIKQAVASGKPVIVPVAGREIGNPYFQNPGPLYHMLVIKGYTKNGKFITNDPGTRHGADFLYSESVIMNAIHDWRTDGNINLGPKVVIVVG